MIFFCYYRLIQGSSLHAKYFYQAAFFLSYFFFQELRRLNFEYWWEVDCLGVMLFTFTRHHPTYNSSYNFIHTHMRARLHYLAEKYIFFSYVACCRVLSIFSLRLYCVSLSYDPVYIFSFGQ